MLAFVPCVLLVCKARPVTGRRSTCSIRLEEDASLSLSRWSHVFCPLHNGSLLSLSRMQRVFWPTELCLHVWNVTRDLKRMHISHPRLGNPPRQRHLYRAAASRGQPEPLRPARGARRSAPSCAWHGPRQLDRSSPRVPPGGAKWCPESPCARARSSPRLPLQSKNL